LRVLIVSQVFWPENFRINDLAAELVVRGHEVTVLTGLPNYPTGRVFDEFRNDPRRFERYQGVDIVRVPIIPRGKGRVPLILNYTSFALSASILGLWKLRGRPFDTIFVYEPSPVTVGIPAVVLRARKSAPMAFWVLDLWPETLRAVGVLRSRMALRAIGALVTFIYNRCDLILGQSRGFVPQIAKYCRKHSAIAYFPNWAEAVFHGQDIAPAPEVPLRPDSFDVMFAGNIGEAQDFPTILQAAELLKSNARIRWLIVGDGRMANWVREEIVRRDLQQQVLMLGRFPVEKMPSFYRHAHALLVSLKDEQLFSMTIPGKLQSYLAAGVPVLAMLNGEGAEVVARSGSGVTCKAGDAHGLAAAVVRLASLSPSQLAQMGDRALQISGTEFDRSKLIAQLETWLERLKAGTRGNALLHCDPSIAVPVGRPE
jgi:glycosyltransferase involved in cell wall biosynthesis